MSTNLHNMFKRNAFSVIAVAAVITMTGCNAAASTPAPKQAEVTQGEIHYSCVTHKDEKFDVKVIQNNGTSAITVDGKKEVTVETMNTSSPFYPIMHGLATGVSDGKEYYTIGLSTCTKYN
jgi:membrane-bound inhibitor of C-type lysozyme